MPLEHSRVSALDSESAWSFPADFTGSDDIDDSRCSNGTGFAFEVDVSGGMGFSIVGVSVVA
eukprot:650807-Amorphochlora_amoeboformis.AAC.1